MQDTLCNIVFFGALLIAGSVWPAQKHVLASHVDRVSSPDGKLIAVIRSSHVAEASDESRIELRTATGKLLTKRNLTSSDGEHGFGVTKAAWTPDSQFFVVSLASSGGHQGWHSPVQFFSRKNGQFLSLDDALHDAVTNPEFSVSAPDVVTVELYFSRQNKTVTLSKIAKRPVASGRPSR